MSILSCIKDDIKLLIDVGLPDKEISIAVGEELHVIQHIINYFRPPNNKQKSIIKKK